MNKGTFCLDALPDMQFEGYTVGDTWNGWECPFFTEDVAEDILRASEANGYSWRFSTIHNGYVVSHVDDKWPATCYDGQRVTINGNPVTVYAIGTYEWTWSKA